MSKLIIYGDIHGCYDEFISLRNKINPQENDIEVCVGDIITKGKESIKTLDYIIEHNIQSVLGNHEDKIIRYLKHQQSKKKNPIILDEDEQNIVQTLLAKHIEYLQSMPLFLQFKNIVVLHGGVQNNMDLENIQKRDKDKILRLRYLDKDGHFVTLGKEDESSVFWADVYDGNQGFIVYGHEWSQEVKISKFAIGIDTGCVYGNKLSAITFSLSKNTYIKQSISELKCNK
jgi:diadenosine tetraphosphatase ApaH/serine/threonine PP2A family protein phosphatase